MTNPIETTMYDISQFFLYPVLLAIAALFVSPLGYLLTKCLGTLADKAAAALFFAA